MKQQYPISRMRELSAKWLEGTITEAEKTEFNEYYNQFNDAELDLPAAYASEADQPVTKILSRLKKHIQDQPEAGDRFRLVALVRSNFRWVAAACIIGLMVWVATDKWWRKENPFITFNTAEGKMSKVILPDSTIVWMKSNSSITYPKSFTDSERNILFTGEALFEVAKDSKHPFVIRSGQYAIRVLGTSFNIRQFEKKNFELMVFTGKVTVRRNNDKGNTYLETLVLANHKLQTTADTFNVTDATAQEAASLVQQTEYLMNFRNDEMKEVLGRLEKKFNVQIEMNNKEVYGCRLTADLTDQSLNRSLNLITDALNLQYRQENGIIYLDGNGCQ